MLLEEVVSQQQFEVKTVEVGYYLLTNWVVLLPRLEPAFAFVASTEGPAAAEAEGSISRPGQTSSAAVADEEVQ